MIEAAQLIPSKDVREYMEKQGRVLFDFEKATLIYNHSGMSYVEIRESLKELKKITQDKVLQEEIEDRLTYDELCLNRFYENTEGYSFELYVYDSKKRKFLECGCYKTGYEAVEYGKKKNGNFMICKVPNNSTEDDEQYLECKASICFDSQGSVQNIYSNEVEWTGKKAEMDRERFENAYMEIPHPFCNGDFVRAKNRDMKNEIGIIECCGNKTVTEQLSIYGDYSDVSLRVAYVDDFARFGHEHIKIVDLEYAMPDNTNVQAEILYCAQSVLKGVGGLCEFRFVCDKYRSRSHYEK